MQLGFHYTLDKTRTFDAQLRTLSVDAQAQVLDKIQYLAIDPAPGNKAKKRLVGHKNNICRIRSGDYRVVYSYGNKHVSLLGVDHRKDVYRKQVWTGLIDDPEFLEDFVPDEELVEETQTITSRAKQRHGGDYWDEDALRTEASRNLPRRLDADFLSLLKVPAEHHAKLAGCQTMDDLIAVDIPEETRTDIFDCIATPNYDQVLARARFRVESIEELRRMLEGELIPLQLSLDPEQERFVTWALAGSGPILLKGSPGTGKSAVAVYRAHSLLRSLKSIGNAEPRILFASYTSALVNSARAMLDALMGDEAGLIEVCTADELVRRLCATHDHPCTQIKNEQREVHIYQAREHLLRELPSAAQAIANLSSPYLAEEIDTVIVARNLESEEDYLTVPRTGRRRPLGDEQRVAIWRLYELSEREAHRRRQESYAQSRRRALRGVLGGWPVAQYDGVIIDEAQDLDPTVIRLLLRLAKSPDRLFLTADSNQSIYGSGFRWKDVHADLRVRGRTSILRRNFRSTRQIAAAAEPVLVGAELDDEGGQDQEYVRSGPLPVVIRATDLASEEAAIAQYLRETTRAMRVGYASCAVLVRHQERGKRLAKRLREAGIPAEFLVRNKLRLDQAGVKVTTFHSAKGLEFPIVAVAGLDSAEGNDQEPEGGNEERRDQNQRALYVALTRAMFALLVVLPNQSPPGLARIGGTAWLEGAPPSWAAWTEAIAAEEALVGAA
jgi:superfamily I DNA/RNA helicase/mRNA-degrading endonuclease RelE of RelBE toxin-antitoxin system